MSADLFQRGEVGESVNVLQTPGVVWDLVLSGTRKSQKNPRSASHAFSLKHLPYSSAFLLVWIDFYVLASDQGFLGATLK